MIIGLTGKKRSGKDTSAEIISEFHGKENTQFFSFAKCLKDAVCTIFFPQYSEIGDDIKDKSFEVYGGRTPRDVLKHIGDSCRQFELDIFIKNIEYKIQNSPCKIKIITDVRYDNEAEFIKKNGGMIIKLVRGNDTTDTHPSEQGISLKYVDYIVENNDTLEQLKNKLIPIVAIE